MGTNSIFVNFRRGDFKGDFVDCDVTSLHHTRQNIESFRRFSHPRTTMLVDCGKFKYRNFAVFLKVLEETIVSGQIWFYGVPLSFYPPTIRSRCQVVGFDHRKISMMEFLKERGGEHLAEQFEGLYAYTLEAAWEMLEQKGNFMSFMINLGSIGYEDFYLIYSRLKNLDKEEKEQAADKKPLREVWGLLFNEWLLKSSIFTDSEIKVCPWLRADRFERVLVKFLWGGADQLLLEFLISYRMVELHK